MTYRHLNVGDLLHDTRYPDRAFLWVVLGITTDKAKGYYRHRLERDMVVYTIFNPASNKTKKIFEPEMIARYKLIDDSISISIKPQPR